MLIVPVAVPQKKGDPVLFAKDEGIRADATAASMAALKPLMKDGMVKGTLRSLVKRFRGHDAHASHAAAATAN